MLANGDAPWAVRRFHLVADGLHARTDGFTSLAVLLGAGGVALGWRWADPVVGLVITVAILGVLRSAVAQVGARLMDAVDPALVDRATDALSTTDGVKGVRELRLRWIGHRLRAEADVTADPRLTITEAHELAHQAEDQLADVPRLNAATVHISPVGASSGSRPGRSVSPDSDSWLIPRCKVCSAGRRRVPPTGNRPPRRRVHLQ